MDKITIEYQCPRCDNTPPFEVAVTFGRPAVLYGPAELCHQEEPAHIEPGYCPRCLVMWDVAEVVAQAEEEWYDREFDKDQAKWEARVEERSLLPSAAVERWEP